jgi:hypothetical protein
VDFIVATPEVYYSQLLFGGSHITWMGAAMTGLLIAVVDTPVHFYLVETGKTQKHSE